MSNCSLTLSRITTIMTDDARILSMFTYVTMRGMVDFGNFLST